MTPFHFFLATRNDPVAEGGRRWKMPLPVHSPAPTPRTHPENLSSQVTYGDYFNCLRRFLETGRQAILRACHRYPSGDDDIQRIDIFLVKHGRLYHPSRIAVALSDGRLQFAANVAVTSEGRAHLSKEYACLKRLNREFDFQFVPRVYVKNTALTAGRQPAAVFLAQWFEDYYEFHACRNPAGNGPTTLVWDSESGRRQLPAAQQRQVYRQAAKILCAYYSPVTFEHITPWHHAAGDFVVRVRDNRTDVKLISARGYVPLLRQPSDLRDRVQAQRQLLEALLVFVLKLSMRMRLDRENGVGQIVWLGDEVVTDTVDGFYDGLSMACNHRSIPEKVQDHFKSYLARVAPDDLYAIASEMATRLFTPAEAHVVKRHLARHAEQLHGALKANYGT